VRPARPRYRFLRALLVAGAVAVVSPGAAVADPSIPGWRDFTPGSRLEAGSAEADPQVRLISHRNGKAAVDQMITPPPARFAIQVRGRAESGVGKIYLEWTEGADREVGAVERRLEFVRGMAEERFSSPPDADQLRVVVMQDAGGSVLRLDSIALREPGGRTFLNEELLLQGCPTDNESPAPPFGTETVPGWRRVGEETSFHLVGGRRGPSPPLRILPLEGRGGLVQYVSVPRKPVTLLIRGSGKDAHASLLAEWTANGRTVQDDEYPVRLRDGAQVLRVTPPRAGGRLSLGIAVMQDSATPITSRVPLALDSVEARTGRRQLLANPQLTVPRCAPAPFVPSAAHALPVSIRWPLTALLLGVGALLLFLLARRAAGSESGAAPPLGSRLRVALLVAVALVPFVRIGTASVGIRIIPADWLFLGLAAVLLAVPRYRSAALADRARVIALFAALGLVVVSGISLILALVLWTDPNLAGLDARDNVLASLGQPSERGAVEALRLLQGVACLFVLLALVHTRRTWTSVAAAVAVAGAVVSAYGIYQVAGEALLGSVPQPPWAYQTDGLRAGGTFPEPSPFAGFLVFSAACAAAVLELRRSKWMGPALLLIIGGVLASRSTLGLFGLAVLAIALLVLRRSRTVAVLAAAGVAFLAATTAFGLGDTWREVYSKPFGTSPSLLEREAVWGAALRMGAEYAPAGAGRGQFAYNQAPFSDPAEADQSGRVSSSILEWWSESGPLGLFFAAAAVLVGPLLLLRRRRPRNVTAGSEPLVVWAMCLSFIVVMAAYYTTSFVWIWVAVGLLATAPGVFGRPESRLETAGDPVAEPKPRPRDASA
jgi:O-antigen ligase